MKVEYPPITPTQEVACYLYCLLDAEPDKVVRDGMRLLIDHVVENEE